MLEQIESVLQNAGWKLKDYRSLSQMAKDDIGYSAPKPIENHLFAAYGIADALMEMKANFPRLADNLKDVPICLANLKKDSTMMAYWHGRKGTSEQNIITPFFTFCTNADVAYFMDKSPAHTILVSERLADVMNKNIPLRDRIRALYKYVTFHEIGHYIDIEGTGEKITLLMQTQALSSENRHKLKNYILSSLGDYAGTSPYETVAEMMVLLLSGKAELKYGIEQELNKVLEPLRVPLDKPILKKAA